MLPFLLLLPAKFFIILEYYDVCDDKLRNNRSIRTAPRNLPFPVLGFWDKHTMARAVTMVLLLMANCVCGSDVRRCKGLIRFDQKPQRSTMSTAKHTMQNLNITQTRATVSASMNPWSKPLHSSRPAALLNGSKIDPV